MRLLVGLLAATLLAQQPPRAVLRVTTPEQDPPLDRAAFRATVNGLEGKITRARGPGDDLVLVIVLDLCGDPALIDTARDALSEQLPKLPPNHWIAVMKAQDALQTLADPGPDREKTLAAIREYGATGKAALLSTIEEATRVAQRLLTKASVRVALLYITDSNVYNYREDFTNPVINSSDTRDLSRRFPDQLVRDQIQKTSDRLSRFEVPLYLVHLNYFSDPINESYQRGLLQLSTESGGAGVFCRSRGEISSAIEQVLAEAARHWNVTVETSRGKSRVFTVDLFNGDRDVPNRARFVIGK
ncbi:MAG: hypothetical protein K2Q23_00295 [Bryobacteraceae bacterium]|nr:hypothetical protein [Bryobacteraceae bacterium]